MKKKNTIYQVDSFSSEPFKGNPAGVCILDKIQSETWMQNIAMEMNLSETAFVYVHDNSMIIRFFSPETEIPLCGHATLAASHILYETGVVNREKEIIFSSKAGELLIRNDADWITMNFPRYDTEKMDIPSVFKKITGIQPEELYRTAHGWTLALMNTEEEVKKMAPYFSSMKNSAFGDLIVTAKSDNRKFDYSVRCFAPALGINEDPVTGSAQCALAPFWHAKTGKTDFISQQVSKRTGILKVSLKGGRVEISGQAKTIFKAGLYV